MSLEAICGCGATGRLTVCLFCPAGEVRGFLTCEGSRFMPGDGVSSVSDICLWNS